MPLGMGVFTKTKCNFPVPTIVRNCAVHDFATFVRICTLEYVVLIRISVLLFIIVSVYMHKKGYSKKHLGVEEGGEGSFQQLPRLYFYRKTAQENSIGDGRGEQ